MRSVLNILAMTVDKLLTAVIIFMFIRMFMSFFASDEETPSKSFVYSVTEPFLMPVRSVLMRFDFFASSPIDFSMTISCFLILLLMTILPSSI